MNIPPFEINDNIINSIALINNRLGYIKGVIDKRKVLQLRKTSKIKSVNSSCAIEANSLSLSEVEGIINGKKVIAPAKEIIEVQNAFNCYNMIDTFNPYDANSFLRAHRIMTENLIPESGSFRKGDVAVYNGNKVVHIGARPQFVETLINDLFVWAKGSETNPIIKACVVHYEIETIHPFSDGNGRMGRFWQSVILCSYNKLFEYIPIETLVYEYQEEYYEAIEESRNNNSSTKFIEFMFNMILKTLEEFETDNDRSEILNELTKTEQEVLDKIRPLFINNNLITIDEMIKVTNKESANLRKFLRRFEKLGLIETVGINKARKYKLIK